MPISRPQKHRWQSTRYTHTHNPPYRKPVTLMDIISGVGTPFRKFAEAINRTLGRTNK
jgi:hypothetical protein